MAVDGDGSSAAFCRLPPVNYLPRAERTGAFFVSSMSTEIKMPQLGESVTEGTVGRWLKRPGDLVAKYEPLLEVVTDKVDTEVPAPVSGTLLEVLVAEGETVSIGTVIARLEASAEAATASPLAAGAPNTTVLQADTALPLALQPAVPEPAPSASRSNVEADSSRASFLSPVVARLVAEHRLDPSRIAGTGQGGRVTKQDVLQAIAARQTVDAAVAGDVLVPAPASAGLVAVPYTQPLASVPPVVEPQHPASNLPPPASDGPLPPDAELLPLTPMRRAIAEHMTRSVRTSPHVTTVMEVDLSQVLAHRAANKASFERQGVRLTLTPYFIQAAVAGLLRAPVLNGSFSEQGILLNRRIHVGMAVALDEGLLVPVLRDADEKNLLGLARAVNDLAERARTRRLKPDETQGGTFTVTNHGVSGSVFATPIINQPQAGILGIGATVKRPVVVTHNGVDAIAIKPICYLSLTFDHRIADGALGDAFLAAAKQALEEYGS